MFKIILRTIQKTYTKPLVYLAVINFATVLGLFGSNIASFIGLQPCMLCNIQRFISFVISIVSCLTFIVFAVDISYRVFNFCVNVVCSLVIFSHIFSWYQLAVEKGFLAVPPICKQFINVEFDLTNIGNLLARKAMPPCNQATKVVFNFSIAELTFSGTICLAILTLLYLLNKIKKHQK